MSNPYSIGLMPVFETEEKHREFANQQPDLFSNFNEWFGDNLKRHSTMVLKMKLFIIDNWGKINDWSNINIKIHDILYSTKFNVSYNENGEFESVVDKIHYRMNFKTEEVVYVKFNYDYCDGDLVVEINDVNNWKFLNDIEIIDLAIMIEDKLNKKNE